MYFSSLTSSKNKLRLHLKITSVIRRPWRCQRGNQNPQIEEGQTTKWPMKKRVKGQSTISQSTTQKTKYQETHEPR